jgi:hypothetical protein
LFTREAVLRKVLRKGEEGVVEIWNRVGYPAGAHGGWKAVYAMFEASTGMKVLSDGQRLPADDGRETISARTIQRRFNELRATAGATGVVAAASSEPEIVPLALARVRFRPDRCERALVGAGIAGWIQGRGKEGEITRSDWATLGPVPDYQLRWPGFFPCRGRFPGHIRWKINEIEFRAGDIRHGVMIEFLKE